MTDSCDSSELVFYTGDKAYAIASNGSPVCLGSETNTKLALSSGVVPNTIWGVARWMLYELINKKEMEYVNQPKISRSSDFRSRPARDFEHRASSIRRSAVAKRLPVHQT